MSWESKAVIVCSEKGLKIVPDGFEGGWVFVKDRYGKIFPIGEDVVSEWIFGSNN